MIEECCVRRGSINQVEGTKVGVYKWLMVSRDCVDYNSAQIEMGGQQRLSRANSIQNEYDLLL